MTGQISIGGVVFFSIMWTLLIIGCTSSLVIQLLLSLFYCPGRGQYDRTVLGTPSTPVSYIVPGLTVICNFDVRWWFYPLPRKAFTLGVA